MRSYHASRYQKRFFIEWKLNPQNITYNTPLLFEVKGELNLNALSHALSVFIHHYDEGCRSHFVEMDDVIKQMVSETIEIDLKVEHLNQSIENPDVAKQQFIDSIVLHPFDLNKPPLYKFGVLFLKPDHAILVFNFHHIISDAITAAYFIEKISEQYNAYLSGKKIITSQQFPARIHNENNYSSEQEKNDLLYWENLLKNSELYLDIPFVNEQTVESIKFNATHFELDPMITKAFKKWVREQHTSLFIALSALFSALLLRYTQKKSLVFNYPVNMRTAGFKELTGCYVNNVLFKVEIHKNQTIKQLICAMTAQRKQTRNHQHCTLLEIIQNLRDKKILIGTQYFNVDFYEAYLGLLPLSLNGLQVQAIKIAQNDMLNDIGMAYQQLDNKIQFKLEYKTELFDQATIDDFVSQYIRLIKLAIKNPDMGLESYSLLSDFDFQRITNELNAAYHHYDTSKSICVLFENIAAHSPENILLQCQQQKISYRELNKKVNQLAWYLTKQGVGIESYVGVYFDRSFELIIAILAIMKAGGAYVPLDPNYPESHLQYIIDDSAISIILTTSELAKKALIINKLAICIDEKAELLRQQPVDNLPPLKHLYSCAYVIYTSGSTGRPKGVVVTHHALLNHNLFVKDYYALSEHDAVLQFSSINFDISVEEIFPTLISGGKLVLYAAQTGLSIKNFLHTIKDNKITCINLPTAFWHILSNELDETSSTYLESLRLVVVGGEQAQLSILQRWQKFFGTSVRWINTYGPTEATIISSVWEFNENRIRNIPIGKPIANSQLYITDENLNLVPYGVTGELLIAGENLARCYLQQPNLTAEKFIPNPFSDKPGMRLYKTGDYARYLRNGTIEYIGRIDQQVKIRGYRIEPSDIENALLKHDHVRAAVVITKSITGMNDSLMAYVVMNEMYRQEANTLKSYLSKLLPEYMIPAMIISIENIPLTPNGKIDKKALSAMPLNSCNSVILAENQIEKQLVSIFQESLKVSNICITDNFFDLGAHSLLMLKIHKKIEDEMKITLPVIKLFEYPNIKALACYISSTALKETIKPELHSQAQKQRMAFEQQRKMMMKRLRHERQ